MLTAATFVVVYVRYCNLYIFGNVISHCGAMYEYHVVFEVYSGDYEELYVFGHDAH
jgi:hypothetical protein